MCLAAHLPLITGCRIPPVPYGDWRIAPRAAIRGIQAHLRGNADGRGCGWSL